MGAELVEFIYNCQDDCNYHTGCPGHSAIVYHDNTSDYTTIIIPHKKVELILDDGLAKRIAWAIRNPYPTESTPSWATHAVGRDKCEPIRKEYEDKLKEQ